MEYIRQWKVGERTFESKHLAQRYHSELELSKFGTVDELIAHADEVIALLKPFATPKPRKRGNGTKPARSVPRQAPKAEVGA